MATLLYRPWSGPGGPGLIYVGITNDWERRKREHEKRSPWWPQVRYVTFESYPTRTEALWAEWVAIVTEQPAENRHMVGTAIPPPRPRTAIARIAWHVMRATA
jgi:hypothetical protein